MTRHTKSLLRFTLLMLGLVATSWVFTHLCGSAHVGVLMAAPVTATTEDIFSRFIPAIRTNVATCGLMTVCNASVPKPSELDGIFKDGEGNYRLMEAMFMHQLEMNSCNIVQSNLYNFLMANKVNMSKKLVSEVINAGMYRIRPYILVQRKHPINNNYWQVAAGAKCDSDGTPDAGGAYWSVQVTSPTNIPLHQNWFNPKERLFINGLTVGGTSTNTAWQVVSSTVAGNGTYIKLVLSSQNTQSYMTATQLQSPVTGLLVRGTANVSDFESFCARPPGLITNNEEEYWIETTRDAACQDDLYEQWRDLIMANNPLYAKWFDLPTIEYNKQSGEDFQRRWITQFFFGKALPYQTIQTADQLDNIETVPLLNNSIGARCVGKRANAIGILEQHAQANRVIDLQGAPLNLPALFKQLYVMQRVRKDSGANKATVDTVEMVIPSQYYPAFNQAMLRYYKDMSNGMLQMFMDVNKGDGGFKVAPLGFKYRDYPLMWPNITLRVVTDEFFDDYLAANTAAGQELAGRMIWIIDWSRIYLGVFGSERVVNKTGDLKTLAAVDASFACVMKVPTQTTTLTSFTWTAIAEAPQGNLIFQSVGADVPEHAVEQGSYPATTTTTTSTTTTTPTTTLSTTTPA